MTPYALECINLSKAFGQLSVLEDVTFGVEAGQLTALLGPSGCGKTTLLRLIAGFEQPDSGVIIINGRVVADQQREVPAEQRRVGMVFQEYALFQHLDVAGNIAFGLRGSPRQKQARASELLALVGLTGLEKRMPYELSGGQQQRVALARALAPRPEILLLDEPFSNLDAALRIQLRAEVKAILKSTGTTCIFVTHDQEEALSFADQVAVMLGGRILQVAPPQQIYHHPASLEVAEFVGESNRLTGHASGGTVTCLLGEVSTASPMRGPVDVLIRPEALSLHPANGQQPHGHITWREFYGHDQRLGVVLSDGTSLVVRLGPEDAFEVGQEVSIRLAAPAMIFPRHAGD